MAAVDRPTVALPDRWCFNQALRRLLPILLLAVFLLPLFAPLLSFGQGGEAQLPACCRRTGAHHCALSMAEDGQASAKETAPFWKAPVDRCPFCPASIGSGSIHDVLTAPPAQAFYAEIASHPAGSVQTEARRRIARDRSRQERGPPSLLSSSTSQLS